MRCWSAPVSAAGSPRRWRCATHGASRNWCWRIRSESRCGGVTDRDIADMHAIPRDEYMRLAWADPAKGERDLTQLPETELAGIARGREAFARVRLEALHAQPAAEALAAPHRHPDLAAVGRAGRHRQHILRRGVARRDPWRAHGRHRRMPVISRIGNSRAASPTGSRVSSTATEERAMRCWYFSEMAYHPAWEAGLAARHAACGAADRATSIRRPAMSC